MEKYDKKECSMKLVLAFLVSFLVFSCGENEILQEKASIWICHNPESEFHDKICPIEGENPCLVQGDTSKFCWELAISDCNIPENFEYCENSRILE